MYKIVVSILLSFVILCPFAAGIMSVQVNGIDSGTTQTFSWGDEITFTGSGNESPVVYINLGDPADDIEWVEPRACRGLAWTVRGSSHYPITPSADRIWSYDWDTGKKNCKYPNVDTTLHVEVEDNTPVKFDILMKGIEIATATTEITTATPTPTETVNYSATIAVMQSRQEAIETQVTAVKTRVASVETKVTAIETVVAAQAEEIDALQSLMDQIWAFLFNPI